MNSSTRFFRKQADFGILVCGTGPAYQVIEIPNNAEKKCRTRLSGFLMRQRENLEEMTHSELPWIPVKRGFGGDLPSDEVTHKETMENIVDQIKKKWNILHTNDRKVIDTYIIHV